MSLLGDEAEVDGQPLGVADALAVGEDFQDLDCPILQLVCGEDDAGAPVTLHVIAVGYVRDIPKGLGPRLQRLRFQTATQFWRLQF